MVEFKHIAKSYAAKTVFSDFNLSLEEEKVTCLLGESGSGKTTLLNIAAGLIPFEGTVERKERVSYIFQEPRLLPNLTAEGNLRFVSRDEEKINFFLSALGLADKRNRFPSALSGGEKQRVAMARAFVYEADLLLMDEPFSALDIKLKIELAEAFLSLWQKERKTVLFVTHNVDEACMLAHRILILENGKLKGDFENGTRGDYFGDAALKEKIYQILLNRL